MTTLYKNIKFNILESRMVKKFRNTIKNSYGYLVDPYKSEKLWIELFCKQLNTFEDDANFLLTSPKNDSNLSNTFKLFIPMYSSFKILIPSLMCLSTSEKEFLTRLEKKFIRKGCIYTNQQLISSIEFYICDNKSLEIVRADNRKQLLDYIKNLEHKIFLMTNKFNIGLPRIANVTKFNSNIIKTNNGTINYKVDQCFIQGFENNPQVHLLDCEYIKNCKKCIENIRNYKLLDTDHFYLTKLTMDMEMGWKNEPTKLFVNAKSGYIQMMCAAARIYCDGTLMQEIQKIMYLRILDLKNAIVYFAENRIMVNV